MNLVITIQRERIERITAWGRSLDLERVVKRFAIVMSIAAIIWAYVKDVIVAYGDAESHLNIAKRVVDSLTPGFAQLGGIWLPLPHLLMAPFVYFNWLWRTGLAGSIVSGFAFVVSTVFIYRLTMLFTENKWAGFIASLVFISNPNALYMQATPMTEMLLIMFQTLSVYFFVKFLQQKEELTSLLMAALFGFASVLTRYDGWFLVLFEAAAIGFYYLPNRKDWSKAQGRIILFASLAFFGIFLWLMWDFLILGDPLYFTNSEFSAKSQQQSWKTRGELPSYHNPISAFLYYFVTAMSNNGVLIFALAIVGFWLYVKDRKTPHRLIVLFVLSAPLVFNVTTLFLGQSVIFIPHLTPATFEWTLFNVRYGLMVAPVVALFVGYLFWRVSAAGKAVIVALFFVQIGLYAVGYSPIISLSDGTVGLSSAKRPDAEGWLRANYDGGLLLMDDFARTVSLIRSGIPMSNSIYVGNKPYWNESLQEPEKYARWIVMQENDTVWKQIIGNPFMEGRLYAHFEKAYTSPQILIFRKQDKDKLAATDNADPKLPYRFWKHQCIDTMKTSRDGFEALSKSADVDLLISKELDAIKSTGADCVAIATPYDDEFLPYLERWVSAARARGLNVWFRGNWAAWEGWFGRTKSMTPEDHLAKTALFIREHKDLFRDGDIFTPAPEAENGGPFGLMDEEKYKLYRAFLRDEHGVATEAFAEIGKSVDVNWLSMNGWIARNKLTKETVDALGGIVAIDHYIKDPAEMSEYIEAINAAYGAKVVIGEFGAPIPDLNGDMDASQQAEFVGRLLWEMYRHRQTVEGVNYWVSYGGSTKLLNDDYSQRPVVDTLRNYFMPGVARGRILNTAGEPIVDAQIKTANGVALTFTNNLGEYALPLPAGPAELIIEARGYKFAQKPIMILRREELKLNFELAPERVDFAYRRKLWIRSLKDKVSLLKFW
ncbi:MAG: carboxypeptidase regulatory-like domain-containing protein [Patescibacteria group bacterium]